MVVVVVVITLGAIPDITDESSAGMPPPGTNAVAAAAATVANDDEVGPRDDPSQNGEPWDCVDDGVLGSCTVTVVDVITFALMGVTLRAAAGAEALGTAARLFVLLACALPPSAAMLAARGERLPAILGDDFHRTGDATSASPVDR